jgi:hypothetical protein
VGFLFAFIPFWVAVLWRLFPMGSLHTDLRLMEVEWGRGLWLCVSFLGSLVYPIILFMFILYALGEGWLLRYDMI